MIEKNFIFKLIDGGCLWGNVILKCILDYTICGNNFQIIQSRNHKT